MPEGGGEYKVRSIEQRRQTTNQIQQKNDSASILR